MTEMVTTQVTVPALHAQLDLSAVQQFANGTDGQLVAIGYAHAEYFPDLSGPVLHFRLPDGRVVLTQPDMDGYNLIWKENRKRADVDEGVAEVVHVMWDQVNTSFQRELLKSFGRAAVEAIGHAVSDTSQPEGSITAAASPAQEHSAGDSGAAAAAAGNTAATTLVSTAPMPGQGTGAGADPASTPPAAWRRLIEALTLLAKGENNDLSPLRCEHDVLYVMADPSRFTADEIEQLEDCGFLVDDVDGGAFFSYLYGSA